MHTAGNWLWPSWKGVGKDDPDYDPFIEEEMEEDRLRAEAAKNRDQNENEEEEDDDDDIGDDSDEEGKEPEDTDEEDLSSSVYNNDGSLRRAKSELATLRAGAPAGGLIAIIELAGTQHKITTDDVLIVNRLKPVDTFSVGSTHTLTNVLLVSSSHLTLVGMPHVTGAAVDIMVEEVTKDKKVIIFKKRRRKHSQRKNGFRRDVTMLRILDIRMPEKYREHDHVYRPTPILPEDVAVAV